MKKQRKQSEIKKLEKKLEDCEKQKKEYLSGWQRERADFINYKKDEIERLGEITKYASTGIVLKLLPVLDNFDAAEKKLSNKIKQSKDIKGLLQIKEQLQGFLKSQNIEKIESLGKEFDPSLHEIVEMLERKKGKSGMIIEEIQKGYKVHGKILRPAKVKVIK
jgi:molecular chaperone GrpE